MSDISDKRNVELFCGYVALMNCKRTVYFSMCNNYMECDLPLDGSGNRETVNAINNILNCYSYLYIILREERGGYIINSGFFYYNRNIVKLNSGQVKTVMDKIFRFEINDKDRFIDSPCSIHAFATIEQDVMNDDNVLDKECLQ